MQARTVNAELADKIQVCPGIKSFFFKPLEDFEYEAGQFSFFTFQHDSKEYSKPFTISNSPTREYIEMTTIISGSDYKKALDSLQKGDRVSLKGPMGSFTLNALKEEYICFLTGGVGITPVKSMMEYAADTSRKLKGRLFYSNRTIERIAFKKELESLEASMGDFKVIHTLTSLNDDEAELWKGETGYIDADMIKRNFKEYNSCRFYIVGPPAFNKAMKKMVMEELGISSDLITLENFAGY